ncbi:serine/threonine-protein kinase [Thermopolyspora sp. NPDC052614]|uniref:serine/threonine-protein kinase n=1 Tax=Thermopolyspora sp. NPDC052614 TaxID=3155682 RepID=UPI00342DB647
MNPLEFDESARGPRRLRDSARDVAIALATGLYGVADDETWRKARRSLKLARDDSVVAPDGEYAGGLSEGDVLMRRYRLEERIATGGMSVIWRAFDEALQRSVAVKVHDGSFDGDHQCRDLIRREARTVARLQHPDVIEVYDYGETVTGQGRVAAFVVMRLLDGRPLAECLLEGPLPWWEALHIAERLALVLAAAHEQGIVHRDVTPENVLLTADGAKLLDFGIAAIADDQGNERLADFGTPPYVAPERLHGVTASPAVDVYSLGVLLFEMLTGELPYPERTWEAIEVVRRIGPPPLPDVPGLPPEAALLCQSCLSQSPQRRPTAQQAAEILARATVKRRRRRHTWPAWAAMSGLSLATLAAGLTLLTTEEPPKPRRGQIVNSVWPASVRTSPTPIGSGRAGAPTTGTRAVPVSEHDARRDPPRVAPAAH